MKFNEEKLIKKALDFGFDSVVKLNREALEFNPLIRDMCAQNRCRIYGKSWSCPPAIGSIEDSFNRTKDYTDGIIIECIIPLEDDFDYESMEKGAIKHQKMVMDFSQKLKEEGYDILPMASGACRLCDKCTYPDSPCRFPDKTISAMEAYGIFVSDLCKKSGIKYNNGPLTMTYIGCILFK